jgi:hypothetical protein
VWNHPTTPHSICPELSTCSATRTNAKDESWSWCMLDLGLDLLCFGQAKFLACDALVMHSQCARDASWYYRCTSTILIPWLTTWTMPRQIQIGWVVQWVQYCQYLSTFSSLCLKVVYLSFLLICSRWIQDYYKNSRQQILVLMAVYSKPKDDKIDTPCTISDTTIKEAITILVLMDCGC